MIRRLIELLLDLLMATHLDDRHLDEIERTHKEDHFDA